MSTFVRVKIDNPLRFVLSPNMRLFDFLFSLWYFSLVSIWKEGSMKYRSSFQIYTRLYYKTLPVRHFCVALYTCGWIYAFELLTERGARINVKARKLVNSGFYRGVVVKEAYSCFNFGFLSNHFGTCQGKPIPVDKSEIRDE